MLEASGTFSEIQNYEKRNFPIAPSRRVRIVRSMIRNFADKETEVLWLRRRCKLPLEIQARGFDKLVLLNSITNIEQMRRPPSHHLEQLRGSRKGQHSIRINEKYRLCFRWDGVDTHDVEITDYH